MSLEHLRGFFGGVDYVPIEDVGFKSEGPCNLILTSHVESDINASEQYYKMIENIKKSERLRIKINKDIREAKPASDILITAIECISLMTGDDLFYKQNTN